MSLVTGLVSLAQAVAADIKALVTGKADKTQLSDYRTILNARFTRLTAATTYEPVVDSLDYGVRFDYTIKPGSPSQAVSPAILNTITVDTVDAGLGGNAHGIGQLDIFSLIGGGNTNLIFGKETRIGLKNASYLAEFVGHKWVLEPNETNSGTIGTITLESLDDMTASAPYVTKFRRLFLDPRMVDYRAGGDVITPMVIDADITLTDKHSGKLIYLNSFSNVTVTIDPGVTDGFRVKLMQGTLGGRITVATSGGRSFLSSTPRRVTMSSYDNVEVTAAGTSYLLLSWPFRVNPVISGISTSTSYTIQLTDEYVRLNSASAITANLAAQSLTRWPDDAEIHIEQMGNGIVTVSPAPGVTLTSPGTFKTSGKGSVITLKRVALDTWVLRHPKQMIFDDLLVNAASTGTVTLDVGAAQVFDLTLSGNTTLAFSNVPVPVGQSYSWLVRVTQGATARTLAFPTVTWLTPNGTSPGAPAASKIIEYIFSTQNGTTILARKGAFT